LEIDLRSIYICVILVLARGYPPTGRSRRGDVVATPEHPVFNQGSREEVLEKTLRYRQPFRRRPDTMPVSNEEQVEISPLPVAG
jgi:hypothetical protein